MKHALLLVSLLCGLPLFAQQSVNDSVKRVISRSGMPVYDYGVNRPVIVPPSPQAQQYMRYGEIPVNLSTGMINIDIPIYKLEANGLNIPISISYHASGNKVDDIASCIGLGWVLNAGGIITQTVNSGIPDDNASFKFASQIAAESFYKADMNQYLNLKRTNLLWSELQSKGYSTDTGSPMKTVSDRFFYQFNGNTGVFRTNLSNGKLETMPYAPIKINPVKGSDGVWTKIEIIDTEGRVWTFKRYKPVQGVYEHDSQQFYYSYEYYPEKITFPDIEDEVTFTYTTGETYLQTKNSQSSYFGQTPEYSFTFDGGPHGSMQWITELDLDTSENLNTLSQTYVINPVLISGISWRGVNVNFTYSKDRKDLMKNRLTGISVTCNNRSICSATFSNSTYLGSGLDNYRMLLTDVKVNHELYNFKYNMMALPDYAQFKCNQDFWGYYNGAENERWIPFEWSWVGNPLLNRIGETVYIPNLREANSSYSQAGILTEITYPTKGKTVFTYEQNRGTGVYDNIKPLQPETDYFGGVRIKQIDNYDGSQKVSTKSYEYMSGGPTVTLTRWNFIAKKNFYFTPLEFPVHDFTQISGMDKVPFRTNAYSANSSGYYPVNNPSGQSLVYTKVIEYNGTPDNNSGKTEYIFSGHFLGSNISSFSDYGEESALMTSQKDYEYTNSSYQLKKEISHNYTNIDRGFFRTGVSVLEREENGFGISPQKIPYSEDIPGFNYYYYDQYKFADIYCYPNINLLSGTTVKTYSGTSSVSEVIQYTYDPNFRILSPIGITRINSDGKSFQEKYFHAFDFPSENIYGLMNNKNMISQVVQKSMFRSGNTTPLQSLKTEYMANGSKIAVSKIRRAGNDNIMEDRVIYHEYNSGGNPVYLSQDGFTKIVYIWGYNNKYPIAEIKNATYSEVTSIISASTLNAIATKTIPAESDWNNVVALRTNSALKNAQVTVYKYIPEVGVSEVIQPNGFTTYYTYDTYGRLKESYFMEGSVKKMVQNYNYNYRNN